MLAIITVLAFVNILLIGFLFFSSFGAKRRVIDRMQNYINPEKSKEAEETGKGIPWREGLNAVGKSLGKSKMGKKYREKLDIKLVQAHIPLKAEEFITVKVIAALAAVLVGYVLTEKPLLAVLTGLAGLYIPDIYLNIRKKSILNKIDQQLPDTIALISNSLKAGYSFLQAIEVASRELPVPISLEFGRVVKEINLGVNTENALEEFSKRVQSEDLELIILAVLIQRQIGGNLSEILDNISDTIRSRIKIKGEVRVLTAQGRMSGLIITLMPILLGAALFLINPEQMLLMVQKPLGWLMLGVAALMLAVGTYSVNKIIRIEV